MYMEHALAFFNFYGNEIKTCESNQWKFCLFSCYCIAVFKNASDLRCASSSGSGPDLLRAPTLAGSYNGSQPYSQDTSIMFFFFPCRSSCLLLCYYKQSNLSLFSAAEEQFCGEQLLPQVDLAQPWHFYILWLS